jgi:transposase InsO family protein
MASDAGLKVQKAPGGRPRLSLGPDEALAVAEYRDIRNVGYQRTADYLQRTGSSGLTEWGVRGIYESLDLYTERHAAEIPDEHPNRFVARYVGQVWHTDLHNLKPEKMPDGRTGKYYLIAFIDDRSRYLLYYEVLSDKTMTSTARALDTALQLYPVPYELTTDNGAEFVGSEFQDVLTGAGVSNWRTRPYTPQQNGKMERYWGTIEKAISTYAYLHQTIGDYNCNWSHNALRRISPSEKKTTPWEAWHDWKHWEGHTDLDLVYE